MTNKRKRSSKTNRLIKKLRQFPQGNIIRIPAASCQDGAIYVKTESYKA